MAIEATVGTVIMGISTFGVGLAIGYYKSLNDMSKLYCLKSDCNQIRSACRDHLDSQDKQLKEDKNILTEIQVDIGRILTKLESLEKRP